MGVAANQILILFLVMAAGFACRKIGAIDEKSTNVLSGIVVKIILPAYLFNAIVTSDSGVDNSGVIAAIALSVGMYAISILIALAEVKLMKPGKEDKGVYLFETMCANVTYIGIPVCVAVFGEKAAFYAALLNIPYNLLCFSLGVYMLSGKKELKKILNPVFISGVIAVALYVLKIELPPIVTEACKLLGQATTPCALLVVGSVLAGISLKDIFSDWRTIPYVFMRLIGIAVIVLLIIYKLNVDPVMKGVIVIMAAMPAATNSTMLCSIYGGNRDLSAKLIFITTALSLITIPLWSAVLEKIM